ncbi:MAG: hypothetical protein H6730_12705 [Deltaproteobacteria bacterium]|nr:hypothetical protein [Deltaproteobacteria bacterium]
MTRYPYDEDVHAEMTRVLYESLPAVYRVRDSESTTDELRELRRLVEVLAAPLATLRQNVEELHADLFIDSSAEGVLRLLAEMVGTTLIFPDVDGNRLDVRGTVGWRRRKGTVAALQEMAEAVSGQLVVTQEGWKRVQIAQDIRNPHLLRPDRVVPSVRPAGLAARASGPLDAVHHAVDIRAIGRRTGKYHPRHIVHWVHPTRMFDMREGTPPALPNPAVGLGVPAAQRDLRWAFRPLGTKVGLRAARTGPEDDLVTDRIPAMLFAERPEAWFGRPGRFDVRFCGLLAAAPRAALAPRAPVLVPASADLAAGAVDMALLESQGRRSTGPVQVSVMAAPFPSAGAPDEPDLAAAVERSSFVVSTAGATPTTVVDAGPLAGGEMVMLRLRSVSGAAETFPATTLTITGGRPDARRVALDAELAQQGYLRGVLHVSLPEMVVGPNDAWLYVCGDGSTVFANPAGTAAVEVPVDLGGGIAHLRDEALAATGGGPAWPSTGLSADPSPVSLPPAPGRGPALVHGGVALADPGGGIDVVNGVECAVSFALRWVDPQGPTVKYEPLARLLWTANGTAQANLRWVALEGAGLSESPPGTPVDADERFAEIGAKLVVERPAQAHLAVRFECEDADVWLPPTEIAWSDARGRVTLIHLPELNTVAGTVTWPLEAPFTASSDAVVVGEDGSTWRPNPLTLRRAAAGAIAPLRGPLGLRRRIVAHRVLCNWGREDPAIPLLHQPTAPGQLDVDVEHGLFAVNASEPPPSWPPRLGAAPAPAVTVAYQDGFTAHVGARPAAREPALGIRLARPTRLVSVSGHFAADAAEGWPRVVDLAGVNPPYTIPRYTSLTAALAAIHAAPAADGVEVVQIEDSATYFGESPSWPAGIEALTIQAAERERPVLQIDDWATPPGLPAMRSIQLIGLALAGEVADPGGGPIAGPAVGALRLPPCEAVRLDFCTALLADGTLHFGADERPEISLFRCFTGPLRLDGPGLLRLEECIVGRTGAPAIVAPEARVEIEACTVLGTGEVDVLAASDSIFMDALTVVNRFEGCVRYSRVQSKAGLPRKHRLAWDEDADAPVPVRFVVDAHDDPAFVRLHERCLRAVRRGAERGSEMGVFEFVRQAERAEALLRRLAEYTPANLVTGLIRLDGGERL